MKKVNIITWLLNQNLNMIVSIRLYYKFGFLILLFYSRILPAQSTQDSLNYYFYGIFDSINPTTEFLLNKGFIYHERLGPFLLGQAQSLPDRIIETDAYKWRNTYYYSKNSQVKQGIFFPEATDLFPEVPLSDPNVQIGIIFINGNYIEPDTIESYLNLEKYKLYKNVPDTIVNIFSISNTRSKVYNKYVIYKIDPNMFFTNSADSIIGVSINFDDGLGFSDYPIIPTDIKVSYLFPGYKKIIFKLLTTSGSYISNSEIYISDINNYLTQEGTVEATLSDGSTSTGKYKAWLGCDSILDKPVIVVEGFDYRNEIIFDDVFQKYRSAKNGNDLILGDLLNNGYDFVSFQFSKNNDYIQNNAQVLKSLIKHINNNKNGHFENIIIGESMGGIISRIALAQLEQEGIDHETGLFISFDSPQGGANIPLSIQSWPENLRNIELDDIFFFLPEEFRFPLSFFDVGDVLNFADFKDPVANMNSAVISNYSPASKQMSIRHINYPDIINPEYLNLQDYLSAIKYPLESRNISLINGSNNAIGQPFLLDNNYIDLDYGITCIAKFTCKALVSPINTNGFKSSEIRLKFGCGWFSYSPINEKSSFDFFDKPYDNCPGSTKSFKVLNNVIPTFVPTVSSIDLDKSLLDGVYGLDYYDEASDNLQRHKKYIIEHNLSPFDDIYAADKNTNHIDFEAVGSLIPSIEEKEIMFNDFYIQNKIIKSEWIRQYYGKNTITVGRDVNIWNDKEIDNSNVKIDANAKVDLTAGNSILFLPGTIVSQGASLHAHIESRDCPPAPQAAPMVAVERQVNVFQQGTSAKDLKAVVKSIESDTFLVFPNPAENTIQIQLSLDEQSQVEIRLYNEFGNLIVSNNLGLVPKGEMTHTLNINNLNPGVYLLCCNINGKNNSKMLMIKG